MEDKEAKLSANKSLNRGLKTHWIGATALCGLLTFLLIGWEHTQNAPPGTQALWTGEDVVPSALAEMEMELRNVHLPMEVNEAVESWMVRFATDRKSVFEEVLSRAGLYSDMIQTKLRERGMPEELLYLAMIESDFHVDARSHVMATGMWQFMGPTARQYGLRIDAYVDERYDPVSGILRRYTDGRRGDESLYWEVVDHLPAETAQYVPKLLAATYLARSAERYGLEVTKVEAYAYDFVWSPGGVDLGQVAEALGISAGSMYDLNPQLIRRVTPPGEIYPLRVPVGATSQVVAALAVPNRRSRLADD